MRTRTPNLGSDFSAARGFEDPFSRISLLEGKNAELEETNRQLQLSVAHLKRLAYLDPLTGLGNRRYFDSIVASELRRSARAGKPLTLLICDIDRFKDCNDAYGHSMGDTVLIEVATVLRQFCRRGGDMAVRYAGDEFALLLPGVTADAAQQIAAGLCKGVQEMPQRGFAAHPPVTLSIGGSTFAGELPCKARELVEAADRALYRAKEAGRNRAELTICG
jgi:diguanylate cyclase (GGDEF)-like protein